MIVVIPTILDAPDERRANLVRLVCRWESLGFRVVALIAGSAASPDNHKAMVADALRLADGEAVIWCEDDVILSSRIEEALSLLADDPVSLYVPNEAFLPRRYDRDRFGCYPMRAEARWWGSQCVYLPPSVHPAIIDACGSVVGGGDIAMREGIRQTGGRLHVIAPNAVEHPGWPSVTSNRYKAHRSPDYAG